MRPSLHAGRLAMVRSRVRAQGFAGRATDGGSDGAADEKASPAPSNGTLSNARSGSGATDSRSCGNTRLRAFARVHEEALRELIRQPVGEPFARRQQAAQGFTEGRAHRLEQVKIEGSQRLQQRVRVVVRAKSQPLVEGFEFLTEGRELEANGVRVCLVEREQIENRQQLGLSLVTRAIRDDRIADF